MTAVTSQSLLLQATAEVAQLAARTAMRWYRRDVRVEIKGDGSPVTIADREAERVAREWLTARFPKDGLHGEEFGIERAEGTRRWILDPIDGTKAFVRGVPLWGTLVACCEGDTVLSGAACFPAVDELIVAAAGEGCWWNGARAQVSSVDTLEQSTLLITDDVFADRPWRSGPWRELASRAGVTRTWGLLRVSARGDRACGNHGGRYREPVGYRGDLSADHRSRRTVHVVEGHRHRIWRRRHCHQCGRWRCGARIAAGT